MRLSVVWRLQPGRNGAKTEIRAVLPGWEGWLPLGRVQAAAGHPHCPQCLGPPGPEKAQGRDQMNQKYRPKLTLPYSKSQEASGSGPWGTVSPLQRPELAGVLRGDGLLLAAEQLSTADLLPALLICRQAFQELQAEINAADSGAHTSHPCLLLPKFSGCFLLRPGMCCVESRGSRGVGVSTAPVQAQNLREKGYLSRMQTGDNCQIFLTPTPT